MLRGRDKLTKDDDNYKSEGIKGLGLLFGVVGVVALLGIYGTYKLITSKK